MRPSRRPRPMTARRHPLSAPVLGWDAKSDLAAVPDGYGPRVDNWIPRGGALEVRWGYGDHVTGLPAACETLMTYRGATDKMFAAAGGGIYDVTTAGAAPSASVSGLLENRWQWTQFNGRLLAVNGEDAPRHYDGSSWAATAWTGPTIERLWNVGTWKSRLIFAERDTASFWYAPVLNVQGTLTELDLAPLSPVGGKALAFASWSRDAAASSPDEMAVFILDSGAVLVYQGTDPGDPTAWAIVGRYLIAPPLGPRCVMRTAGDLVILTRAGYVSLARLTQVGRDDPQVYLSDRIGPAVALAAQTHGDRDGWQAISYPRGGLAMIVNSPINGATHDQHVLTDTGAWARFRSIPSYCWAVHQDRLYFGSTNRVCLADSAQDDDGVAITADARTRYDGYGTPGLKTFTMARPILSSDAALTAALAMETDFSEANTLSPIVSSADTSGLFGWDVSWNAPDGRPWRGQLKPRLGWQTVTGQGVVAAVRMQVRVQGQSVKWHGVEVMVQDGVGL